MEANDVRQADLNTVQLGLWMVGGNISRELSFSPGGEHTSWARQDQDRNDYPEQIPPTHPWPTMRAASPTAYP